MRVPSALRGELMADVGQTASSPAVPDPTPGRRLDSWKEIAAYLKRDVSTVYRWEKREALPVHRHLHDKLGSVYAYTSELDAWWNNRRPRLDREDALGEREPAPPRPQVRVPIRVWAVSVTLMALVAAAGVYFWIWRGRAPTSPVPSLRSVAVLPFQPLVSDARDPALEAGMADALITKLSHIRQLTIRPTESVLKYSGSAQDLRGAGRELRVEALLVGSVQRAGDRIRLSVRLVGARDGGVLWADTFDEQWTHIFAVEDAIATQVARALALRLTGAERERLSRRDTGSPAAYQEYLLGRHFWNQRTAEGLKRGLQHFEQALKLDPRYALAYAGIADSYTAFLAYNVISPSEAYVNMRAAAAKALELDPTLSEVHVTLASVSLYQDWDWGSAEAAFRRAIQLKPDNANAHRRYALALVWFQRFDEALRTMARARELDPAWPRISTNIGEMLYHARRYDQAIKAFHEALALDPNFFQTRHGLGRTYLERREYRKAIAELKKALEVGAGAVAEADLALAYAVSGQTREARKILKELKDQSTRTYISPFDIAVVYAGLGDHDQAFAWLEKAYDQRTRTMLSLKVNPSLDPLRSDPRFAALIRRVGVFGSE